MRYAWVGLTELRSVVINRSTGEHKLESEEAQNIFDAGELGKRIAEQWEQWGRSVVKVNCQSPLLFAEKYVTEIV